MTAASVPPAGTLTLLVVGTGLMGTSIALAATAAGLQVWLEDLVPDAVGVAVARGAGQGGPPAQEPDLVVVAVPPRATAGVLGSIAARYPNATLSDVSSVKTPVMREVTAHGLDLTRFVPGHPIAGGESSGPAAGRADLFLDRTWVLTPTAEVDPLRLAQVRAFAEALGSVVTELSPEAHDRAVALTSHTPQVVSSLLAARLAAAGEGEVRLTGQGLRDTTRIAASDPMLWSQILSENAGPVRDVLTRLSDDLLDVLTALSALEGPADGDRAGSGQQQVATDVLSDLVRRGNEGRARVPIKHGEDHTPLSTLTVLVEDRPGELGRLFAAAGGSAVNLEDVRIDHALGRPTGLVELSVATGEAGRLRTALEDDGYHVMT